MVNAAALGLEAVWLLFSKVTGFEPPMGYF